MRSRRVATIDHATPATARSSQLASTSDLGDQETTTTTSCARAIDWPRQRISPEIQPRKLECLNSLDNKTVHGYTTQVQAQSPRGGHHWSSQGFWRQISPKLQPQKLECLTSLGNKTVHGYTTQVQAQAPRMVTSSMCRQQNSTPRKERI